MTTWQSIDYASQNKPPEPPGGLGVRGLGIDDVAVPGEPQPYAFLIQLPLVKPPGSVEPSTFGDVTVHIRARDINGSVVPPEQAQLEWDSSWTWEVRSTDHEIALQLGGRWYAQAACEAGLTQFSVTNAEGVEYSQQLPAGKKSLHGEFGLTGPNVDPGDLAAGQGFRVETIKTRALTWANNGQKGQPLDNPDFDLTGEGLDRLHLVARCGGMDIADRHYAQHTRLHIVVVS